MKKWIALAVVLACVFCLAEFSGGKAQVCDWARALSREDILSAEPWHQREALEPLQETQIEELVALLNKLTTFHFTENKALAGGTPEYGIGITIGSETYYLNESIHPEGLLEIKYNGKQWLIDNEALADFVRRAAYRRTHAEGLKTLGDGTWQCGGYTYQYRLEIKDRMPNAAADSTFVYLSNLEKIPFDRAWKAAGLSSHLGDYFSVEEAVLVDGRTE